MGQVLSMIWRWVLPKSKAGSKLGGVERSRLYRDGDNDKPDDHLISPPTLNEQPGRNESHCINIFDPDQHPIIVEVNCDLSLSNVSNVVDADREDYNVQPMEAKNDKVLQVVAEEKAKIKTKNAKSIHSTDGISVSVSPSSSSKLTGRKYSIGPYDTTQRILLVGEGDFSFSASLAIAFGSASNMVATSLNSLEFLIKNYNNFPTNLSELETRGSVVLHGVDATKMVKHPYLSMMKFDRIIYNFPHSGFKRDSPESQIRRHQKLVRGFLKNAKKMVEYNGEIHVTHKTNASFLEWDIPKLGSDQGLCLIQAVKFKRSKYPGYHTKYGFGGDKDFDCNPSKTYKFGLTSKEKLMTP